MRRGIKGHWSLDLTTVDPDDGMPWDFDVEAKRTKVMKMLARDKPSLLIGSPDCTAFSTLQNLSKNHNVEMKQKLLKRAVQHVKFCCQLYRMQVEGGR